MDISPKKEQFDEKVFNSAFEKISETDSGVFKLCCDDYDCICLPKIHLVYAGEYYLSYQRFESFILEEMKKYKISTVMVTNIFMHRRNIITNEAMTKYCNGKMYDKDSANDDLESFYEVLRLGKTPKIWATCYFLPKLTKKHMELVEKKDPSYFKTFIKSNPDVDEVEMGLSESKSKFVQGLSRRITYTIRNDMMTENSS